MKPRVLRIGLGIMFLLLWSVDLVHGLESRYFYDELNRLVRVERPDGIAVIYSYDAVGNRLSRTVMRTVGNAVRVTHDQATGATTVAWATIPVATHYNTYRGTIPVSMMASRPMPYDHICHESDDTAGDGLLFSRDRTAPSLDTAFYYLVSGENEFGEGTPGTASEGKLRPNTSPCPTPP